MIQEADPSVPLIASQYDLRTGMSEKLPEPDIKQALETGDWGFVHSFTTGSAVDGPGVRVVAWLTGCQFRCAFCHNPDTWKMSNGMPVSVQRAVEVVKQYKTSLQTMKGGLTISGGEPLMQHKFVLRVFGELKNAGIHTALETNGCFGERLVDQDFASIDLVMIGLKGIEPEMHKRLTKTDNATSLAFARRLAALKRPIWIRFVVVPGWTDSLEEAGRMADFAAGLGNVERVDVLPFHQMGKFKWEKLGMQYALRDAQPPPKETVDKIIARFQAAGLKTV
jgi:pyruvate formate lyase activating enzyme